MSIGINDFISYFDTGARPNFYNVQIIGGDSQGGFQFSNNDGHNFRCIDASLPGVELGTNEEATFGAPRQIPDGTVSYDGGLALTFLCDTHFYDRILIDAWQRFIFEGKPQDSAYDRQRGTKFQPVMRYMYGDGKSLKTATVQGPPKKVMGMSFPTEKNVNYQSGSFDGGYVGQINIEQLSQGGKPRMLYEFQDVYPVSYSEQSLSSSNESGGIMEFEVTFEYKDFMVSYPNEPDEIRKIEPKNNGAKQDPSGKGSILDATLDTLNVLSRFNPKAGEYLNKLSGLEGQLNRGKNISRKIGGLNIGGGGD